MGIKLKIMKNILLVIGLCIGLSSFSQTIDTSIHEYKAAKIVDVYHGNGSFPESIDTIRWVGYKDYTYRSIDSTCTVNYILRANDGRNVIRNSYTMSWAEYTNWDSSDESLLSIIVQYLHLTFK